MSVQKLVYTDESKGHFNEAPEGWREVTEEEFAQDGFWIWGWDQYEHRQICRLADGTDLPKMIAARMFWMNDGTGVAMENDYWGKKIRYYRFGCDHEYEGMPQKRAFEHTSKCKKCGHVYSVDSSDCHSFS